MMNVLRLKVLLGFWTLAMFLICPLSAEELDGIDLFIQACQHQGLNPVMIKTGYAEMEVEMTAPPYRSVSDPNPPKDELQTERWRHRILFSGNDDAVQCLRIESHLYLDDNNKWDPEQEDGWVRSRLAIERSWNRNDAEVVDWGYDANFMGVGKTRIAWPSFQQFGRIQSGFQSGPVVAATLTLLEMRNPEKFIFTEKGKKSLRDAFLMAEKSGAKGYHTVKEESYDEGIAKAKVVESHNPKGQVVNRFWIDPARGYVCPLIQYYDPVTGRIREEHVSSSYFLHAPTGLWYPQKYEMSKFDGLTGKLLEKEVYTINKDTFWLNRSVAPAHFSIDVPEGVDVRDERKKVSVHYMTLEKGKLSFEHEHLHLEHMKWLTPRVYDSDDKPLPDGTLTRILRFSFMGVGIILILSALFCIWNGRKKEKP